MNKENDKRRIEELIKAVMDIAQGDFSVQLELTEKNDHFDALAMGINMMVDDIRESQETKKENERITHLNEQLKKAKSKAEENDKLKSAFLANMSHEIRTPMNGILGFVNLLKEPQLSLEHQKRYIEIIQKSGKRMLNIINDLIDISKIEAGQIEVSKSKTDINKQLEYVHKFFYPEAEKKGIRLILNTRLSISDAVIITDREKLYAILTNLVKNAIKFTQKGFIEIGCRLKNGELEFFVKDTGIGISREKQMLVFDRFVQAEHSYSTNFEGAGLGLSISKAYINMLGGNIWVKSSEGVGTTFFFTIPYVISPSKKAKVESGLDFINSVNKSGKLNVLLVEDDETSRLLMKMLLKNYCHEIIAVNDGAKAVEACKMDPGIDLVFMDIKMPVLNGFEATKQIRQFNKDIIIIAQTAFGLSSEKQKILEAGCNDYISKPVQKDELNEMIKKYFGEKIDLSVNI